MGVSHSIQIGRHRIGRFRFLLFAMILTFVLRPFLAGCASMGVLMDIFFSLILLAGAYAFSRQGKKFSIALSIAIPALILEVASYLFPSEPARIIKRILFAFFFAYLLSIILAHIFSEKEVTEDLITGAVCGYLLVGMVWTFLFYFLELAAAGSFSTGLQDVGACLYFSFVTLTTVGYGDIVPLTGPARSLAVLEAFTGQLYLAITIARLVGIHASGLALAGGDTPRYENEKKR